ncbi:uncharacterized protein [Watersipora subatra]|uniref:uncharacterized protein n=1 Tax=Watersipora subatra TaxID=2589382 RepID=UPI00355C9E0E
MDFYNLKHFAYVVTDQQATELYNNYCGSFSPLTIWRPAGRFQTIWVDLPEVYDSPYITVEKSDIPGRTILTASYPRANTFRCTVRHIFPKPVLFWRLNRTGDQQYELGNNLPGWNARQISFKTALTHSVNTFAWELTIRILPGKLVFSVIASS